MERGPDVTLCDLWPRLPAGARSELPRRAAEADWWVLDALPSRWEALRPLVFPAVDYQRFGELAAGVLRCALLACRRRAGTAGELCRALDDHREPLLLDPAQPLSDPALLRMARPDALVAGAGPGSWS